MVDIKKLQSFLTCPVSANPSPFSPTLSPVTDDEAYEIKELLDDPTSPEAMAARKLSWSVRYMELSEPAGAFSCGTCRHYSDAEGFCVQNEVRAAVDGEYGMCKMFEPKDKSLIVFPPAEGDVAGEPEEPEEPEAE